MEIISVAQYTREIKGGGMKFIQSIIVCSIAVLFLLVPVRVFAAGAATESASQKDTTVVEYELPYPGLLPDNPLYVFKQFRDWLLDHLIVDPAKKAEFSITQADKRLGMGMILNASGKYVLGEQTISKGEKYMNTALTSLQALKAQGKPIPGYIIDHLRLALAKHAELIVGEIARAPAAQKAGLTGSLDLVKSIQGELTKLQ